MNIRRHLVALLATSASFAALMPGAAFADNTNTLKVMANIVGACQFISPGGGNAVVPDDQTNGNQTMDFGPLDQTSSADAAGPATTFRFWCTNGTTIAFTADNGRNAGVSCGGTRCLSNGTSLIPYSLIFTTPTGTALGPGTPISVTFTGSIANANYVNAPAGTYEDFVYLTATP